MTYGILYKHTHTPTQIYLCFAIIDSLATTNSQKSSMISFAAKTFCSLITCSTCKKSKLQKLHLSDQNLSEIEENTVPKTHQIETNLKIVNDPNTSSGILTRLKKQSNVASHLLYHRISLIPQQLYPRHSHFRRRFTVIQNPPKNQKK